MNNDLFNFLIQGSLYLYFPNSYYEFIFELKEEVDESLLGQSLIEACNKHPYFSQNVISDGENISIEKVNINSNLINADYEVMLNTDKPLFKIECKKQSIHFYFSHFLADGHGALTFMNCLLNSYFSHKYNVSITKPYVFDEFSFDWFDSVNYDTNNQINICLTKQENTNIVKQDFNTSLLKLNKKDIVDLAIKLDVKPFCLLISLICIAQHKLLNKDTISFTYPIDARKYLNINYPGNLSILIKDEVTIEDDCDLATLSKKINDSIVSQLNKDNVLKLLEKDVLFFKDAINSKLSKKLKSNFILSNFDKTYHCDFGFSYIGSFFSKSEINDYINNFYVYVYSAVNSDTVIEETTFNDELTFSIGSSNDSKQIKEEIQNVVNKYIK